MVTAYLHELGKLDRIRKWKECGMRKREDGRQHKETISCESMAMKVEFPKSDCTRELAKIMGKEPNCYEDGTFLGCDYLELSSPSIS